MAAANHKSFGGISGGFVATDYHPATAHYVLVLATSRKTPDTGRPSGIGLPAEYQARTSHITPQQVLLWLYKYGFQYHKYRVRRLSGEH